MKRLARTKFGLTIGIAVSFAVVAIGVASPPDAGAGAKTYLYVGGHRFGIGEEQVYLIDRESTLTVRYRGRHGDLQSKIFHRHAQSSVAWTIEGIASGGNPVLGVATAAPAPLGSVSVSTLEPARPGILAPPSPPSSQPTVQSPMPSPMLDAHGGAARGGALGDLAPVSILLSSIKTELPDSSRSWKSSGEVRLSYGVVTVDLDNFVAAAAGQDTNVMQVEGTGTTSFQATIKVPDFGVAALRGAGSAKAISFLESENRLLLGMRLAVVNHGNATAKDKHGTYELNLKVGIKLAKYVPGIPLYDGPPAGFVPASGYLGGTTTPDAAIYSTAAPDKIAIPAATDTGFIPAPPAPPSPYVSALPAMSLPPIPLPMSSDQPVASPPAGPTPTPQPTHY